MAKRGNGFTAESPQAPEPVPSGVGALDLKARLDRYGEILAKSLDLAEAGVSLGLTVIGTVGAAAHDKILSRLLEATTPGNAQPAASPAGPSPAAPPAEAADASTYGITNRLQLVPGAPVSVSFSINNDSPVEAKQVSLTVEAIAGQSTGAVLLPGTLAVLPSATAIAPMDFEKFVLQGAIPPETPPDVYYGFINVGGEGGTRIPVRLIVEPGRGA